MIGAIIGDIIGSTYEFIDNVEDKNFELFVPYSMTTDDSIMTLAVGQALVNTYGEKDIVKIQEELVKQLQKFGREYPYGGYGLRFKEWLKDNNPQPYNSYGNGSGMRVSSVAWLYDNLEDINKYAEIFIGGGAVLFDILSKYKLDEVYISDKNLELINTYKSIRDNVDILIKSLKEILL